jgi:DNA-binding transcriptional MocR family regulator
MTPHQQRFARWTKAVKQGGGPIFELLAQTIVSDIKAGALPPGFRLPTHRDLADKLGITVGTASRAYSEIRRTGLIEAGVGRGTFVRTRAASSRAASDVIDLRAHCAPTGAYVEELARTLGPSGSDLLSSEAIDRPAPGTMREWSEAGARWFALSSAASPSVDSIVSVGSIQQGLICSLLSVAQAGDTVLTEKLTYGGLNAAAAAIGIRLVGVSIDRNGLIPEALDEACKKHRPKALVCVPTVHNPTTCSMPARRRALVAEMARQHGITVIEDDAYAPFGERITTIQTLSPDNTILLGTLSKAISPSLRAAFIAAPAHLRERIATLVRATGASPHPLAAEVASRWIADGTAERIFRRNLAELKERNTLLREKIRHGKLYSRDGAPHAWLELPPRWRIEDFMAWAHQRQIAFLPASVFAVDKSDALHALRISLSAARDRDEISQVAERISSALEGSASDSVVF